MSNSYNNADMTTLDEFESRLQSLLEVHLLKHLPGYKVEDGIAQQLAVAMHSHLKEVGGETQAPNLYVIVAHPSTLTRWHAKPRLLKELANALYVAGKEAGFHFSIKPTVATTAENDLSEDELRVIASFSNESVAETQGFPSGITSDASAASPDNAFLIVGGNQLVPLSRSVTNIGRRLDNHVVIDDPRVSRAHAQLRVVKNHFVLFDLNSSGGTFVNGHRSNQSVLYPGDVISLAGVTLIFGQDLPAGSASNEDETQPGLAESADRTKPIYRKEKDLNK
jgi:pSer/pThr/pTyr-binding forkhead associated (FHA) protein